MGGGVEVTPVDLHDCRVKIKSPTPNKPDSSSMFPTGRRRPRSHIDFDFFGVSTHTLYILLYFGLPVLGPSVSSLPPPASSPSLVPVSDVLTTERVRTLRSPRKSDPPILSGQFLRPSPSTTFPPGLLDPN